MREALGEYPHMQCSGCEIIAAALYDSLTGQLAREFKTLDKAKRPSATLEKGCKELRNKREVRARRCRKSVSFERVLLHRLSLHRHSLQSLSMNA